MEKFKYNHHHALWERRRWMGKTATKQLREFPTFVWKIPISLHDDLHANIGPIDPICTELAYSALAFARDRQNSPDAVDEFIDYMRSYSRNTCSRRGMQAEMVADHLEIQQDFINNQ